MKFLWVIGYLSLFIGYGLQAQNYTYETYQTKEGHILPYRMLLPTDAGKKPAPVILFLHGAGERGNDNEKQLTHGSSLFTTPDIRNHYPAIVLMPQCPEDSYWASMDIDRSSYPIRTDFNYPKKPNWPLQAALDVVEELIRTGKADPDRIYIMGLSMGGMGTFEALIRWPKKFAAAAAICGGGKVDKAKRFAGRVPVWVFHGDADGVVPVDYSRKMVSRLKELGAQVKYTEYPGVNHNSWDNAFAEPELLPWLFAHERGK